MCESIRFSDEALRYAHDAWDQLESLNSNMLSIYGLVDPPGTEDLTAAFKEAKLLTRDRVVWQTMGRFRDVMDMMQSIEYISEIVKGDQTRISQLRHAFLKIHSDMLVQLIGRHDCWQPFALNLGHNRGDFNVELLLSQIDQFKQAGLLMDTDNDHPSIMQLPVITQQAMRNTKSIIHTAHELNDGRIGASSDMARCLDSLNHLSRDLSHQHFVDPVLQNLTSSMHASLLAVQQAVGAWAHLHSISWKGLMLAKHAEDGARKLRKLVNLVEKEIILAACAYLGTSGLADFGFIEHVVRHEISSGACQECRWASSSGHSGPRMPVCKRSSCMTLSCLRRHGRSLCRRFGRPCNRTIDVVHPIFLSVWAHGLRRVLSQLRN